MITQGVAHEVEGENGQGDDETGEDDQPPLGAELVRQDAAEHVAPTWRGLGDAQTEKAQRGLGKDGAAQ